MVSDGDFYTWEKCPTCNAVAPEVFTENPDYRDEGLSSENYMEYIFDRFGTIEKADEFVAKSIFGVLPQLALPGGGR